MAEFTTGSMRICRVFSSNSNSTESFGKLLMIFVHSVCRPCSLLPNHRRIIWQCNRKFKNDTKCTTPHVDEEILKERFLQAVSEYMADPEDRIEGLRTVQHTISCTDFIDADIEEKETELELLSGMIRNCIMMNASASLTEQEY